MNRYNNGKTRSHQKQTSVDRNNKQKNPNMFSSTSTMDAGPLNFHARIADHEGDIMSIAIRDVVTAPPTTTIIDAIKTMKRKGIRHLPITDAGTNRIEGIVTSFDLVDFLGGGKKNLLVENKFKGNLLSAVNTDVRSIMQHEVYSLHSDAHIRDAFGLMIDHKIASVPILDHEDRVHAICTERDFLAFIKGIITNRFVGEYMNKKINAASSDTSIGDAAKIMVDKETKKLPIVKDGILIGIVTASDIMNFLGSGEAFDKLVTGNIHEAFDGPVSSLIVNDVVWTSSDIDLGEAAEIMIEKGIGSLPVIDDEIFRGVLTEKDIIRAMAEKA
ncbi:MAG: CBS domain-containing protein [Methanosarcinaceae archaeon]|nr:CBS domain-containing protein [Methanosarcinaceae archaeon]